MTIPESTWSALATSIRAERTCLVDLRSPGEFATGRIPQARNLALLDDAERKTVGTLYKQVSRCEATQTGLELFAVKAERFLEDLLAARAAKPEYERLVLHCWRGGMRSGSVARWLTVAGVPCIVLRGGYKVFRREIRGLFEALAQRELLVLVGRTGSGKTDLLREMLGTVPALDLEGIARHRGSAFGDFAQSEPCPTQQDFENQLGDAIHALGDAPRVLVEIENFIGPVKVPPVLRERMRSAPLLLVEREFDDRVVRLVAEYAPRWTDELQKRFEERLEMLAQYLSREVRRTIAGATARGDFATAVAMLLTLRYDRTYDKTIARTQAQIVGKFNLTRDLDGAREFLKHYLQR